MDHNRRAYHRDLDGRVRSALRVARIDQRGLMPQSIDNSDWTDYPTDYVSTLCWLLGDATYERYRDREKQVTEYAGSTERKLSDFAGGEA